MTAPQVFRSADELTPVLQLGRACGVNDRTMLGWYTSGVRGHVLRTVRVGGRVYARPSWLAEFIDTCNRTT